MPIYDGPIGSVQWAPSQKISVSTAKGLYFVPTPIEFNEDTATTIDDIRMNFVPLPGIFSLMGILPPLPPIHVYHGSTQLGECFCTFSST